MAKRPKYQKKMFESAQWSNDTSANIYMSMLMSDAWMDLTNNQKTLYLYCKAQYYAQKDCGSNDPKPDGLDSFTMNRSKWCKLYKIYTESNNTGFYRDMAQLIYHGFIVCSTCGQSNFTKSVYRYSSMWQKWGTPEFKLLDSQKTNYMLKQEGKK